MSKSRAGLTSMILFFTVCIGLTVSAPVSERRSNLVGRSDYDNDLVARSFEVILKRPFNTPEYHEYSKRDYLSNILYDRDFDMADNEYVEREYNSLSTLEERELDGADLLYVKRNNVEKLHRRGFFDGIRNAFHKMGSAITSGFHKVQSSFQKAGRAIKGGFQKVGQGFKTAGNKMRSGFQKVGQVFKAAGNKMRGGFQKIGQGLKKAGGAIRSGFRKVGTYLKKSGAMIGKFALKTLAATASVASRVVKFIPGVGTVLSKALKGVAMGANEGSKRIHATLPGNLEKASEGMDYVISPASALGKLAGGDKAKKAFDIVDNIF